MLFLRWIKNLRISPLVNSIWSRITKKINVWFGKKKANPFINEIAKSSHHNTNLNDVGRHKKTSYNQVESAFQEKRKTSNPFVVKIVPDTKKEYFTSNLQAGINSLKKENPSIDRAEACFNNLLPSKKFYFGDEKTLFEKFCLQLAEYYEQLFLGTPASVSFSVDKDPQAKMYLEKTIFFLQQIPNDSEIYKEVQFKILNFQKYHLKNSDQVYDTLKKMSIQGDMDSTREFILINFKKYWEKERKQLQGNELTAVMNYESSNKPWFEQIKNISCTLNKRNISITLLKEALVEIKSSPSSIAQADINELESKIEKLEEKSRQITAVKLQPRVKKLLILAEQLTIDSRAKEEGKSEVANPVQFFSKFSPPPVLAEHENLLQAYLDIFSFIKNHPDKAKSNDYFVLIERTYAAYLLTICSNLLSADISSCVGDGNYLSYHEGAVTYENNNRDTRRLL